MIGEDRGGEADRRGLCRSGRSPSLPGVGLGKRFPRATVGWPVVGGATVRRFLRDYNRYGAKTKQPNGDGVGGCAVR